MFVTEWNLIFNVNKNLKSQKAKNSLSGFSLDFPCGGERAVNFPTGSITLLINRVFLVLLDKSTSV